MQKQADGKRVRQGQMSIIQIFSELFFIIAVATVQHILTEEEENNSFRVVKFYSHVQEIGQKNRKKH